MVRVLLVKQGDTTQFGMTSKMTDMMMSVDGQMLRAKGGVFVDESEKTCFHTGKNCIDDV